MLKNFRKTLFSTYDILINKLCLPQQIGKTPSILRTVYLWLMQLFGYNISIKK